VRGSQRFTFRQEEFDNPLLRPHFLMYTGGTGGRPNRVGLSLAHMDGWADSIALALEAHGLHRPPVAFWWPIALPRMAAVARIGCPVVGWFYPVHPLPKLAHLMAYYQALLGRLGGYRFPLPERCDLETPEQMVDWLTMQLQTGRSIVVWTMASAGVRIGIAASAAGRDLRGVTLFIGSEAVTDTRRRHMESSGAQVIARYTSTEFVGLAYSCPTSAAADDVHVMLDRYAIVERLRPSSEGGPVVNALLVTSLSTTSSKIALNTEMGDYARVEERDCGCLLGELGMRTHLSEIRSFEKLTGEGVSFARSNLEQILEEVLPRRFGGTSLDYQIAEEEGPDSATRLVLRVSPSAGEMDEAVLSAALLEELGKGGLLEQYQAGAWRTAGTIEIRREPPLATQAGKVLPLHLLRRDSRRP
jgi:hypothetical protein